MPNRYPSPTRTQRAEMERHVLGYPCLIERHEDCGRRIIVDRNASPDDWQDCRCPCHAEQVRREGPMTNKVAIMREPTPNPSFVRALQKIDETGKGRIIRPTSFRDRH